MNGFSEALVACFLLQLPQAATIRGIAASAGCLTVDRQHFDERSLNGILLDHDCKWSQQTGTMENSVRTYLLDGKKHATRVQVVGTLR